MFLQNQEIAVLDSKTLTKSTEKNQFGTPKYMIQFPRKRLRFVTIDRKKDPLTALYAPIKNLWQPLHQQIEYQISVMNF